MAMLWLPTFKTIKAFEYYDLYTIQGCNTFSHRPYSLGSSILNPPALGQPTIGTVTTISTVCMEHLVFLWSSEVCLIILKWLYIGCSDLYPWSGDAASNLEPQTASESHTLSFSFLCGCLMPIGLNRFPRDTRGPQLLHMTRQCLLTINRRQRFTSALCPPLESRQQSQK